MLSLPFRVLWGVWCLLAFTVLALLAVLAVLVLPGVQRRRAAGRGAARAWLRVTGLWPRVTGFEHLPDTACVIVANHASYLDGPLLFAIMPPRFRFVIKKEMASVPVAGLLLHRLGHDFVERHNRHAGGTDTRRLLRAASGGEALAFFPEGTFHAPPGIARFHAGAFVTAVRSGLPIVPVAIRGTRAVLPAERALPQHGPLSLDILPPLVAAGDEPWDAVHDLRDRARAAIIAQVGEPDLATH